MGTSGGYCYCGTGTTMEQRREQDSRHFHIMAGNWLTLYLPTPAFITGIPTQVSILLKSSASFVAVSFRVSRVI